MDTLVMMGIGVVLGVISFFLGDFRGEGRGIRIGKEMYQGTPARLADALPEVSYRCLHVGPKDDYVVMRDNKYQLHLFSNHGEGKHKLLPVVGGQYRKVLTYDKRGGKGYKWVNG